MEEAAQRRREAEDLLRAAANEDAILSVGGVPQQIRLLRAAAARDPGWAEARFRLATVLEGVGKAEDAEAEYAKAADLDPGLVRARARLALLLLHYHPTMPGEDVRHARGRALLQTLLREHPDDPHVRLAKIFADADVVEKATPELEAALAPLAEGAPEARLLRAGFHGLYFHPLVEVDDDAPPEMRDLDFAYREVSAFCSAEPLSVTGRMFLAILRYELGDNLGAERDLTFVIASAPDWGVPRTWYGRLLFVQGRLPDAERELRASLALREGDRRLNTLAAILAFERRYEEALEAIRKAAAHDPEDAAASLMLPILLLAVGKEEEAEKAIENLGGRRAKYIEQLRDFDRELQKPEMALVAATIRNQLAEFQDVLFLAPKDKQAVRKAMPGVLGIPRIREALRDYQSRLRLDREVREILFNLPSVESDVPELFAAVKLLFAKAGIRADAHLISVLAQFGFKLAHDAELQHRQTLLTPDDALWRAGIHYRNGWAAKKSERAAHWTKARADVDEALRLDRTNARAWYASATVFALQGDADRCADALRRARSFGWRNTAFAAEDEDFAEVRKSEAVRAALGK